MSRSWLFSGLVLFLGACSVPPRAPQDVYPAPTHLLALDRAFSGRERAAIALAVDTLRRESRGCVRFQISEEGGGAGPRIVRELATTENTTLADDRFRATVYGWAGEGEAHIVVDRHRTDRALTHTTMHELLHLLGVQHVSGNTRAVMAKSGDANESPLVLSLEDKIVLATATGCGAW